MASCIQVKCRYITEVATSVPQRKHPNRRLAQDDSGSAQHGAFGDFFSVWDPCIHGDAAIVDWLVYILCDQLFAQGTPQVCVCTVVSASVSRDMMSRL
jgi:hypothetical protein